MSPFEYDLKFAKDTIWQVGVAGLVLGAGLPVLFAGAIKALAWGEGGEAETSHARPNPLGKVIAAMLFLIVVYAIVVGIIYVIATGQGEDIRFHGLIIPEIFKPKS